MWGSLQFLPWTTSCFVLIVLNVVHGFEDPSPTNIYELKVYQQVDGSDCLKDRTPIDNLIIDKSFTPEEEKQILLEIYQNTNGKSWYNQSGWSNPNETSHCNWFGISCHSNTSYVKSIAIYCNNLKGSLPNTLWKLRNLLSLCAPGNPMLRGRLEYFIFANMTKLQIIHFDGTALNGRVPEAVGNLSLLEKFMVCTMNGEGFTGNLPENLGNMKEMAWLCLGGNSFTGQIPRSISKMRKLRFLDLRNAPGKMWGFIEDLFSIKTINDLFVSGINLTGKMPSVFPKFASNLVLPGNNIHGNLPTSYPVNLSHFNVANNRLTGDIPGNLFFLSSIEVIDASQNLFSSVNNGTAWPAEQISHAKYVSLAGNKNLAIEFESFVNIFLWTVIGGSALSALNVSYCNIRSPFPPELQYVSTLLICDLRGNRFYGKIPGIHMDTLYLSYLDISYNNFTGDLPQGIDNLMSLQFLDISGNSRMNQKNSALKNIITPDFSIMSKPTSTQDNFTCPQAKLTFNNGRVRLDPSFYRYKHCACDPDFYGDSGLCKKCMQGGTCKQPVAMTAKDVISNTIRMHAGYWPSPSAENVTHLVRCPVPKACNPHGNCTCRLQTEFGNHTRKSPNRSVSSLITTCNTSCICHKGNTDRFCSRCQRGFYKTGGLCYPCPKAKDNLYFYIFIPLFAVTVGVKLLSFHYFKAFPKTTFSIVAVDFLLLVVLTLLKMLPAWVLKLDVIIFVLCMTNRDKASHSALIEISVSYIQTLDSMVSTVDVWPREVFEVQQYISSFWNLHFSSLSCEFSVLFSPVGKFAFILLLPIICMLLIGLYFVISIAYDKYKHQEYRIRTTRFKCRQLTMSCLNFTYFPIVEATVSVLRPCESDRGIRFMAGTPWIECDSQTFYVFSIMGWISVIVYVIGFPAILFTLMAVVFRKRAAMSIEERNDMDSWLGSVYLQYKPKYQLYFELVLVFRRLLLAFALSFLCSFGSVQTVVVWLILTVSVIVQFRLQPYQTSKNAYSLENIFEFITLFVLSLSFMVLRFADLGSSFTALFVWCVMVLNGCVLAGLVTCIMYLFALRHPYCCIGESNGEENNSLLKYPGSVDD